MFYQCQFWPDRLDLFQLELRGELILEFETLR